MTEVVKEFIEDTIEFIDNEDYDSMFRLWYLRSRNRETIEEYRYLEELFNIFQQIGVDIRSESEEARKNIIRINMYDIMDNILTNDLEVTRITLPDIVKSLNSKLQVSLITLNEMFKLATSDIAKVHNVRREPFKVIRN